MSLYIRGFATLLVAFFPLAISADDDVKHIDKILMSVNDVYPAWTQVHFEVQPGTWATIVADEKADKIVSLQFSYHGKAIDVPKPCLDDLHYPVLETAGIGLSLKHAWLQFKTTTFDENGNGQDEKDMSIVRFTTQDGVLIEREIIQEKSNDYTSWTVVDLSKGLSKDDIEANRCGTAKVTRAQ